jgi:hypothetical protein
MPHQTRQVSPDDDDSIPPCPLFINDLFDTIESLKTACRGYAIHGTFEFKTLRSTTTRYEITCKFNKCPWKLYATSIGGAGNKFRIRTHCCDHSCTGIQQLGHQQATAKFIENWILPTIKINPQYRQIDIIRDVKARLFVTISRSKAFRAKEYALELLHGTYKDAYKQLPQYIADIARNNLNSLATIESTSENQFKRAFICYDASAMGIAHCRPLLGLDGTHLKTRYQGILLAATGVDAHGQLFPLVWAVVDAENNDNWLWMLRLLRQVLEQSAPHFLEPTVIPFIYVFNLETYFALRQTKGTHRRCRSSFSDQSTWLLHASSCRKFS